MRGWSVKKKKAKKRASQWEKDTVVSQWRTSCWFSKEKGGEKGIETGGKGVVGNLEKMSLVGIKTDGRGRGDDAGRISDRHRGDVTQTAIWRVLTKRISTEGLNTRKYKQLSETELDDRKEWEKKMAA